MFGAGGFTAVCNCNRSTVATIAVAMASASSIRLGPWVPLTAS